MSNDETAYKESTVIWSIWAQLLEVTSNEIDLCYYGAGYITRYIRYAKWCIWGQLEKATIKENAFCKQDWKKIYTMQIKHTYVEIINTTKDL